MKVTNWVALSELLCCSYPNLLCCEDKSERTTGVGFESFLEEAYDNRDCMYSVTVISHIYTSIAAHIILLTHQLLLGTT